jgi:2-polyprenyl-6-methoxyphenol hydroxylase-like FAD-dependent oxidoreductase
MMKPLHAQSSIAVIGGSLIGPLFALLLRQSGFENVHIYEATPQALAMSQAGGTIGLDWLSLEVLDALGINRREIILFDKKEPVSIKINDRREVERKKTIYAGTNTTWTLLHQALMKRLGNVHMGKRLTSLSEGKNGQAVLQFADGTQVESEFVVFADGRKSFGRKLLDPSRELNYAGYVAIRGQLSFCPNEINRFVWYESAGRKVFNACPIVHNGQMGVDWTFYVNADHERFRLWFGEHPAIRTFVPPHMWSKLAHEEVEKIANALLPEAMVNLIQSTKARMAASVVDIAPPDRMVYQIGSTKALLVGDALGPVQPHTAKGANHGISQVAGLAQIMRQHREYGLNLEAGLADWQRRWLPQVAATLELGRDLAQRFGFGGTPQPE